MLADDVEWVIGVDTRKEAHTAAVVDRLGGVTEKLNFAADLAGYRRVLTRASERGGRRVWGVEGTGSYGAGLPASCRVPGNGWSKWNGRPGL